MRSPEEYRGKIYMMKPPQENERTGQIPNTVHIFYESALNSDDTFKSVSEIENLYQNQGITAEKKNHYLLCNWRKFYPYLVCLEIFMRIQKCMQL